MQPQTQRRASTCRRRASAAATTVLVGIAGVGSVLMALGVAPASAQVPTWIAPEPSDPSSRPLWVSLEAALTADGSLRSELFSEFAAAMTPADKTANRHEFELDVPRIRHGPGRTCAGGSWGGRLSTLKPLGARNAEVTTPAQSSPRWLADS